MPKWAKWLIGSLILIMVLSGITAFVLLGYVRPHRIAENTMPSEGKMILHAQEDGSVRIQWPMGINSGGYRIAVLRPSGEEVYSADAGNTTEHLLPALPGEELTIRVSSYQTYRYILPNEPRIRDGERSLQITGNFQMPTVTELTHTADPEADTVTVNFNLLPNTTARLYRVEADGSLSLFESLTDNQIELAFGYRSKLPMPGYTDTFRFIFDAYSEFEGYIYYGLPTGEFSVVRDDLLGSVLNLQCTDLGNNQFRLTWTEAKGDHYEVQQYDPSTDSWATIQSVPKDADLCYQTGHLQRYSDIIYRVISVDGEVEPETAQVTTGASVVFSTIWPIKDLEVYKDTGKSETLATAKEAKALCVLDVQEDLFYVRVGNTYGYIDSNYCMINLPDMIGDICLYDITNSYDSLYMVHEYEIPAVTGTVIKGYEDVELSAGNYLVPLLYPTALKLEKAAFSAINLGYKLKIYDSYRPNKATLDIYDIAKEILEDSIPEQTYSGKPVDDLPELPEPAEGEEPPVLTYQMLMTDNGRYSLAHFLAKGGSRHNQGIAMDLTVTKNGEDLEMQTAIHDLSWYSEIKKNNKNAKLLKSIMEGAGFGGLNSEWWHYQDNEAKQNLEPPYMKNGVTPEGWLADDTGWRYRRSDGRFHTDCEKTIDDVTYRFDENGYVIS